MSRPYPREWDDEPDHDEIVEADELAEWDARQAATADGRPVDDLHHLVADDARVAWRDDDDERR